MTLVVLGVEHWPEPTEQPADRSTLAEYDVPADVLQRWREKRRDYLSARAALVGRLEVQGWRPPTIAADLGDHLDVVFTAPPGGPDDPPAEFVELEDSQGRSVMLGEWVERDDGYWVLRLPRGEATR